MSNEEKPLPILSRLDARVFEIDSLGKENCELKARIEELKKENKVERENNVTANRVIDKLLSHKHEVEQKYEKLYNEFTNSQKELHDITVEKNKLSDRWDKVIEEVEKLRPERRGL